MQIQKISIAVASLVLATSSFAAPVVYNLSLPNISTFDGVVTGTGSTVVTAQVTNTNIYNYISRRIRHRNSYTNCCCHWFFN